MSVARGFVNAGHFYNNITKPIAIDLQFTVTPTNGLGVTSVKSNGYVRNVFMHTSTTPTANDGYTNPNPGTGFAWIQLKQNFNAYLGSQVSFVSALSGSDLPVSGSGLVAGSGYVITQVGTSTTAGFQALGLPPGLTPTVGQSFIALVTGGQTGTGQVELPSTAGVTGAEVVGTPSTSINNAQIATNGGAWVMVQFLNATTRTTPSTGTTVCMTLHFDGSSVTVDGL